MPGRYGDLQRRSDWSFLLRSLMLLNMSILLELASSSHLFEPSLRSQHQPRRPQTCACEHGYLHRYLLDSQARLLVPDDPSLLQETHAETRYARSIIYTIYDVRRERRTPEWSHVSLCDAKSAP